MDIIDQIFYISSTSAQKNQRFEKELIDYGFDKHLFAPVQRMNWKDKYSGFTRGYGLELLETYIKIFKQAQHKAFTHILLFTVDSFNFIIDKTVFKNNLTDFFEIYETKYDMLLLTYDLKSFSNIDNLVGYCKESDNFSGLIINQRCFQTLVDTFEWTFSKYIDTQKHWIYNETFAFNQTLAIKDGLFLQEIVGLQEIFSYTESSLLLQNLQDYINHTYYINLNNNNTSLLENAWSKLEFLPKNSTTILAGEFKNKYPPSGFIKWEEIVKTDMHLRAIQKAKEVGYKNIAIFEDTFKFSMDSDSIHNLLLSFYEKHSANYAILSLTADKADSKQIPSEPICINRKDKDTSGYIVNEIIYDQLIKLYKHSLDQLINTQQFWNYSISTLWPSLQNKFSWYSFKERIGGDINYIYNNKLLSYFSGQTYVSDKYMDCHATTGLVLYPDGTFKWLNDKPGQITSQLFYEGPIVGKIKKLVTQQKKVVIIPFCDEEPFYLNEWVSPQPAKYPQNQYTWVRKEPIIDTDKYNLYKEEFGDDFIALTVSLFKGKPSFPNVRVIPWSDEVYACNGRVGGNIMKNLKDAADIPFSEKLDKVIWCGSTLESHINCTHPRNTLGAILGNYEWADIKHCLNGWYYTTGCNAAVSELNDNYLSISEQCKYKGIFYIDGAAGASCENWIFLSGSVVLKIARWESCVIQNMKPWHDFIPIKWDLSDVVENVEWIFKNPLEAEKIANNGKETYLKYTAIDELNKVIIKALDLNKN